MTSASILAAGYLLGMAIVLLGPAALLLARAAWPVRAPRAALALWQAIAWTGALSIVGAAVAFAVIPLDAGFRHGVHVLLGQTVTGRPLRGLDVPQVAGLAVAASVTGWLIVLVAGTAVRNARVRRRHRGKIELVADRRPGHQGVRVIDHPAPLAYCLPGVRPRVVITSGLTALLDERELAAVLAHERAHVRGRHHVALLPFNALARAISAVPTVRLARDSAAQLVEMLADDQARRRHGGHTVAAALLRMAAVRAEARPPAGALSAAEHPLVTRVRRMTEPATPAALWQRLLAYFAAAALAVGPAAVLLPCMT